MAVDGLTVYFTYQMAKNLPVNPIWRMIAFGVGIIVFTAGDKILDKCFNNNKEIDKIKKQ